MCGVDVGYEVDVCFWYCDFVVFGCDVQCCVLCEVYVVVYCYVVYQCDDWFWECVDCVVELVFVDEEWQLGFVLCDYLVQFVDVIVCVEVFFVCVVQYECDDLVVVVVVFEQCGQFVDYCV